jgi:hypothetical protein
VYIRFDAEYSEYNR